MRWERFSGDRDTAKVMTSVGVAVPANPYPLPDARLEDRPGYPFAANQGLTLPNMLAEPCAHPDPCACSRCSPVAD